MTLPPLIGLSGKAGTGKSTVARHLAQKHGYRQLAFAGALKDLLQNYFCLSDDHLDGPLKEEIIPRLGKSARWLMQEVGTRFRELWPEIWLFHLEDRLLYHQCAGGGNGQPVVVTDVRFPNEAALLRRLGGKLLRLERPGHQGAVSGIPGHCSETALDDYGEWDAVISEAAGSEALCAQVEEILEEWQAGKPATTGD